MKLKIEFLLLVFLLTSGPSTILAQWAADPAMNTVIRDAEGMLTLPHVVPDALGNTYLSWYSDTGGEKFDMYLQRLDINGNKLWPDTGLMIGNYPTYSWVSDYSLAVDHEGYAIVTYPDKRNFFLDAYAYRISPNGTFAWGPDGIRLTDGPPNDWWPQVLVTEDNQFIFYYDIEPLDTTLSWEIGLQKLDVNGNRLWGENILTFLEMDCYMVQALITEQGNLIVSWLEKTSLPDTVAGQQNYMHIFLQKFDPDGLPLWPEPVQADTGQVMAFNALYTVPYLSNNGADGAFVTWQSIFLSAPTIKVNNIGADGEKLWQPGGIQVEESLQENSMQPSVFYNAAEDKLYVFYLVYKYDNGVDCWGVGGQRFSPDGERLWGEPGKLLLPLNCTMDTAYIQAFARPAPENRICLLYENKYDKVIGIDTISQADMYAGLLDANGNFLWTPERISVSNADGYKGNIAFGNYTAGQWVTAWADNRDHIHQNFYTDIYAQNITLDGTIGPLSVKEPAENQGVMLTCYPNPAEGILHCQLEGVTVDKISRVSIFDIQGKMITTKIYDKSSIDFDLKNLIAGIYIIKAEWDQSFVYQKLVIK